ncbi:MAG: AAA family ATPase, partial [Alphaproteobacteria bacterium]|nr:AAA family ATPase [Alphaproteobacteria bacterium]
MIFKRGLKVLIAASTMITSFQPASAEVAILVENENIIENNFNISRKRQLFPGIGMSDYADIAFDGGIYVDKSRLISEILNRREQVFLFTRPRRWGKSTNLNMMQYFFNPVMDERGKPVDPQPYRKMFKQMQVNTTVGTLKDGKYQEVNVVDHYQGQHPTIFISLKDVKHPTFSRMQLGLEQQVTMAFQRHYYLRTSTALNENDRREYSEFIDRHLALSSTRPEDQLSSAGIANSLLILSSWLYKHHGKKAIILVDEYDTPLNEAYLNGYGDEATALLRGLFGATFKDNPSLEKAVLTGILRIAKAGLFSALNNLREDTVLDSDFSRYYGFTEKEVTDLLRISQDPNGDEVRRWYNGYRIGNETIYNPWSVMNYISARNGGSSNAIQTYWVNSGGVDFLKQTIMSNTARQIWENYRSGQAMPSLVSKHLTAIDFETPESLHSILLHTGYLTLAEPLSKPTTYTAQALLKIPNFEVRQEFEGLLSSLFLSKRFSQPHYIKQMFEAILDQDAKQVVSLFKYDQRINFTPWNFNFLQIAALVGNKPIFNAIANKYPDLLDSQNPEGLGIADFAAMNNVSMPKKLEGYPVIMRSPHLYEHVCLIVGPIAGGFVGGFKWIYDLTHAADAAPLGRGRQVLNFAVDALAGTAVGNAAEITLEKLCKTYSTFTNTDISKPKTMKTMM